MIREEAIVTTATKEMLSISEIYTSIQGEGRYTGIPTTFVRLQGCPLRCIWCDSRFTWPFQKVHDTSVDDVIAKVEEFNLRYVCVTGGEPLAQNATEGLFKDLIRNHFKVTCETSGAYPIYGKNYNHFIEWVLDMKCPDSTQEHMNDYENLRRLRGQDQLKFVVSSKNDFDWSVDLLLKYRPFAGDILFSPVWEKCDIKELVQWLTDSSERIQIKGMVTPRLSLQIHKVIWPIDQRGV